MIISITPYYTGQVQQVITRWKLVSTDNLATITSAGYLNSSNLMGYTISPNDVLDVVYSYTGSINSPGTGTYVELLPSISYSNGSTVITLSQYSSSGNIPLPTLPTIANHIVVFKDTAGSVGEDATTAINGGNIQAGLSGTAGTVASFPATSSNGSLILAAINAGGAFNTTISNSAMGQSTVYSLADIGASTGGIPVATGSVRMKQVAQAAVAGGAAAQTVTDTFCTSASNVIAVWNDTTNAVSIQKVAAGNGSFVVTSSGDPGASHLNYIIMK